MNGENVADGMGITHKLYKEMLRIGADVVTLGNHTWAKKDAFSFIGEEERLIRPANYSKGLLGKGYVIVECKQKKIAVINKVKPINLTFSSNLSNKFSLVTTRPKTPAGMVARTIFQQ